MNLIQYLLHNPLWRRLPMPPHMYSVEFEPGEVDQDTATLMQLSHTRCPQGVEILKQRHKAQSSRQLITSLPSRRRRRRPVAQRLLSIVRHAFGLLPYDPMRKIARQHMRKPTRF